VLSASPFWIFWIRKPLVCIVGGKGGFEIEKCQLCDSSAAFGRKEDREWRNVSRRVELQGIGWCNITSWNAFFFFYCADQKGEPRYARDKKKKDDSLASINQGPGGERAGIPRTEVAWQAHNTG